MGTAVYTWFGNQLSYSPRSKARFKTSQHKLVSHLTWDVQSHSGQAWSDAAVHLTWTSKWSHRVLGTCPGAAPADGFGGIWRETAWLNNQHTSRVSNNMSGCWDQISLIVALPAVGCRVQEHDIFDKPLSIPCMQKHRCQHAHTTHV